jgi:hypothetical protein
MHRLHRHLLSRNPGSRRLVWMRGMRSEERTSGNGRAARSTRVTSTIRHGAREGR